MITYLKGDATNPQGSGNKILCHICNDIGGWGKGFVLVISKKWPEPERQYREWHKTKSPKFELGKVQFIEVRNDIIVANMIGQHGIKTGSKGPPIRYEAVKDCLKKVAEKAKELKATVHMPVIGCGLGMASWDKIEPIIQETLVDIDCFVYIIDKQFEYLVKDS